MAARAGNQEIIDLLKQWNLPSDQVKRVSIHFEVNEAVKVQIERYLSKTDIEGLKTITDNYELVKAD